MSRKTAVCVLFVFLLTVAPFSASAGAGRWDGDVGPAVSEPAAPTAIHLASGGDIDPDGLEMPEPTLSGGDWLQLLRFFLGTFLR